MHVLCVMNAVKIFAYCYFDLWHTDFSGLAVHYEGLLAETGDIFDSTHEDNTIFSFEIGKGTVIRAWDIAVKTMRVHIGL